MKWIPQLWWMLLFPAIWASTTPFQEISFDDAIKKAGETEKLVFVDFYTTWCGPCKMLDRTTWKDKDVLTWLDQHAIALKIDAEKHRELAETYQVQGYPTLLFVDAKGAIRGKHTGVLSPQQFLDMANGVLNGVDPVADLRKQLEASPEDVELKIQLGRKLQDLHRPDEAMHIYLQMLGRDDESAEPSMDPMGLMMLARLAAHYEPARKEVLAIQRELEQSLEEETLDVDSVAFLFQINVFLDQDARNPAIYDEVKDRKMDPKQAQRLTHAAWPYLLEARRYRDMADRVGLNGYAEETLEDYRSMVERMLADPTKAIMKTQLTFYFVDRLNQIHEVLLGVNQVDAAQAIARKALEIMETFEMLNRVAWSGYRSGNPTRLHLELARKALDLTQGKDAAIVDTAARLMWHFNQGEEARALVKQALEADLDDNARGVLENCLADFDRDASH